MGTATACCAGLWGPGLQPLSQGEIWLYRVSIWNDSVVDRDLDTCNKSDTQGSVVQSDLKLGLLTGSRAKTDAWLFSAMLFPFCLAGSQEEQGLECEPFGGGLRPPLLSCFAGAGLAGAAFPREGAEDIPGAWVAGLYLEQSIGWEGKGNAAVGGQAWSLLIHLHLAQESTGPTQSGTWEGFSHKNTDSAHRAKGFVSQRVPTPVWERGGTSQEPGTGAACPASGHGVTAPAISLGGVAGATNKTDLSWLGTANPAATTLGERQNEAFLPSVTRATKAFLLPSFCAGSQTG